MLALQQLRQSRMEQEREQRDGSHGELPRRAPDGVRRNGNETGIESKLDRQPGQGGVTQTLRHHEEADRNARHGVVPERVAPRIGADPVGIVVAAAAKGKYPVAAALGNDPCGLLYSINSSSTSMRSSTSSCC